MNAPVTETMKKSILSPGLFVRVGIILIAVYIFMHKEVNLELNLQNIATEQTTKDNKEKEAGAEVPEDGLSENASEGPSILASLSGVFRKKKQPEPKATKVMFVAQPTLAEVGSDQIKDYVERFGHVAVSEARKFGIPASITLANGIYQSSAGRSVQAKEAHNHFSLPCTADWDGMMKDVNGKCFRKYESAWAGFRGHSRFITNTYPQLKKLGKKNHQAWAKALQNEGFNKDPKLERELLRIIKEYDLSRFDQ